jgi:hypothetical protein
VKPYKTALLFGVAHFSVQIAIYIVGFALGSAMTTRKILGISFYDISLVVTFPFVYLAEHYNWRSLGMISLQLNSLLWAGLFYISLFITHKIRNKRIQRLS